MTSSQPTSREPNWDATFAEVNCWRGACLHHFSAVEMAVTETLLALSTAEGAGGCVRLRQLIGQRFEDLAAAIGPDGLFVKEGQAAFVLLSRYRCQQEGFRAALCHGAIRS